MTQVFGKTLTKGDTIVVSYGNYLRPAIFLDYGKNKNPQFYLLSRNIEYHKRRISYGKKPYVDYISRKGNNTIAKINPSELSDEYKKDLDVLYNFLKENGYL